VRHGLHGASIGIVLRATALAAAVLVLGTSLVAAALEGGRRSPEASSAAHRVDTRRTSYWTVREAESLATVRGVPVHVQSCTGIGRPRHALAVARYDRFACTAGTGLDWESFDSVAVTYTLVPLGPYEGGCSRYALREVRFVGAGIP